MVPVAIVSKSLGSGPAVVFAFCSRGAKEKGREGGAVVPF